MLVGHADAAMHLTPSWTASAALRPALALATETISSARGSPASSSSAALSAAARAISISP